MADEKKDKPSSTEPESPPSATLEVARKFLNDEKVQLESDEKKTEFLKSKGYSDEDTKVLLEEQSAKPGPSTDDESEQSQGHAEAAQPREAPTDAVPQQKNSPPIASSSSNDTPPIITYPEFLVQSPKAPPLLTPSRLANGATVLATGWTLVYGIARFIVNPMIVTQSEARSEYYKHVSGKMDILLEKLEGVVSEVPYKNGKNWKPEADADDDSSCGDPTEMFHRDIGEKPVDKQAESISRLSAALEDMSNIYISQAENTTALYSELREFREEIDKLAYPSESLSYGGSGFGIGRSSEPDDEIKKCKDAIRSVKGMFLSARNFPPAGAAR